jgi:asparagine synthase (glutamine-hydrolysing)
MSRPVETFTVAYKDHEELNELDSARDISRRFATSHHEVLIGEREMLDFLPDLVFHQDEPLADPVCVPLYYVSRLARESGTVVVQVGEGSDELFSGYDKYVKYLRLYDRFWRHTEQLPAFARRAAGAVAGPLVGAATGKAEAAELARRFGAGESLFWGAAVVFDETLKSRLVSAGARGRLGGLSSYEVVREDLERFVGARPASDFLARMTYLELKLRLPELLLMRVDKMTMATSVEARVPFLDHHLVEYAMGVPRALKVEGRSGKHVLKRALEGVLPRDLLYRRKRGFGAPVRRWMGTGLGDVFRDLLEGEGYRVTTQAYLDKDIAEVEQLAPDLIILDYMWAEEDAGWALLQMLQMSPKTESIPIILCTGAVREVEALSGHLEQMGIRVVIKPFSIYQLLDCITEVLGSQSPEPAAAEPTR